MKNLNPVVCTLTSVQRLRRGTRWKGGFRRFAERIDRLSNGIAIALKSGVALGELRELVALEAECCCWMNLELRESESPPTLTITADTEEGVATIARMLGV